MWLVYLISFPNGKHYVGVTTNFNNRKNQHKYAAYTKKMNTPLYNAFRKYGWENINFSILENEIFADYIDSKEINYIAKYAALIDNNGYNLQKGGVANKEVSEYTREKLRSSHIGRVQSQTTIDKRVKKNTGQKRTDEAKIKMSKWQIGRKMPKETINKMRAAKSTPIGSFDLEGKLIKKYASAREAERIDGYSHSSIGRWIRGEVIPQNNFIWKYINQEEIV